MPAPEIRILVRPTSNLQRIRDRGITAVIGDLRDRSSLREATAGVDAVLHLAALTRARDEPEFRSVNEKGTESLLRSALEAGSCRRFVYLSSLAAAGPALHDKAVNASQEPKPLTAYGRSKLAGERACESAGQEMEIVILRPPAVYGPRDRDLLPFFKLAGAGILPVPIGPRRRLQMVYAPDLAQAIVAALFSKGTTGVYHVAEADAYAWEEVLDLMARAVGRRGRMIPVPPSVLKVAGAIAGSLGRIANRPQIFDSDKVRELLAPGWLCETARAKRELGFSAQTDLKRGLERTANWYRENGWLP